MSEKVWWQEPDYVNEGETVWLPYEKDGKVWGIRCTVTVAAGNHARISCPAHNIDRWVALRSLLVPPEDLRHPHHRAARERASLAALG